MTRKTHANKPRLDWHKISLYIGLFAVLALAFVWLRDEMVKEQNSLAVEDTFNRYDFDRLSFCYERDIRPCDTETLVIWNADHPSDNFTPVRGPEERLEKLPLTKGWLF